MGRMPSHGSDSATSAIADENALISRMTLTLRRSILGCWPDVCTRRVFRNQPELANSSNIWRAALPSPPSSCSNLPSSALTQRSNFCANSRCGESKNGQDRWVRSMTLNIEGRVATVNPEGMCRSGHRLKYSLRAPCVRCASRCGSNRECFGTYTECQ